MMRLLIFTLVTLLTTEFASAVLPEHKQTRIQIEATVPQMPSRQGRSEDLLNSLIGCRVLLALSMHTPAVAMPQNSIAEGTNGAYGQRWPIGVSTARFWIGMRESTLIGTDQRVVARRDVPLDTELFVTRRLENDSEPFSFQSHGRDEFLEPGSSIYEVFHDVEFGAVSNFQRRDIRWIDFELGGGRRLTGEHVRPPYRPDAPDERIPRTVYFHHDIQSLVLYRFEVAEMLRRTPPEFRKLALRLVRRSADVGTTETPISETVEVPYRLTID